MIRSDRLTASSAIWFFGIGVVIGLWAIAIWAPPSNAHSAADYYPSYWQRDTSVNWRFEAGFPTDAYRSRVKDGIAQWNNLNQTMSFVQQAEANYSFSPLASCPSNYQQNAMWWQLIDGKGGIYASTNRCFYNDGSNELYSANVVFDKEENWYTGTGDADDGFFFCIILDCEIDVWSIASHELGHAAGFAGPYDNGHFDSNAPICEDNEDQHTMCPFYVRGSERVRTLEEHDWHTFSNRY